jgi:hypothetical protein
MHVYMPDQALDDSLAYLQLPQFLQRISCSCDATYLQFSGVTLGFVYAAN